MKHNQPTQTQPPTGPRAIPLAEVRLDPEGRRGILAARFGSEIVAGKDVKLWFVPSWGGVLVAFNGQERCIPFGRGGVVEWLSAEPTGAK